MSTIPLIVPIQENGGTAETIHEVELLYHASLIEQLVAATQMQAQLQAQAQALEQQMTQLNGARMHWIGHLANRYQLQNGDTINDQGVIVRVTPPPVPGD